MQFAPVGAAISGQGQGPRQLLARLALGPERGHHQPPPAGTPQPGQHPGPQQGGFAGTRGAEQHQQAGPTQGAAGREPLDQMEALLIPAEVDGSVFLLEGQQAWIGRSGAIPGEAALGGERKCRQLRLELLQARFPFLSQIEHLQIGSRDRARVCIGRFDHLEDRLAESPGLGELGETPLRGAPIGALED